MSKNPEPCPFCGGKDIRITAHLRAGEWPFHVGGTVYSIGCYECGATVPNRYNPDLLVDSWNIRQQALLTPSKEKVETAP